MIVKSLSVLRKNGSERNTPSLRESDALHTAYDLLLENTRLAASASLGMHEIAQVARLVDFLDLALLLDNSQGYNCLDKFL